MSAAATMVRMDIPVIELAHPMPGFPDDERFALVRLDEDGMLLGFRSLDSEDLQFVVVPPAPFFPDYAPEIGDDLVADLGIDPAAADDVLVLLVVRAGATLAEISQLRTAKSALEIETGNYRVVTGERLQALGQVPGPRYGYALAGAAAALRAPGGSAFRRRPAPRRLGEWRCGRPR